MINILLVILMVGFVQVCLLVDEKKSPGNYSIPFNAKDLPVGIYYYRLQTETGTIARKTILIK